MSLKKLFFASVAALCVAATAANAEGLKTDLKLPAYPLVTIDPNTSAWSMSANLYDSPVKHWTGKDFPLTGALMVDGKIYRFMGKETPELKSLVGSGDEEDWTGKYTFEKPSDDWMSPDYNDADWAEAVGPFGTKRLEPSSRTEWDTPYIWVRREVMLKKSLKGKNVYIDFSNDDDAVFYVNGIEVHATGNRCNKNKLVQIPAEAAESLRAGRNVIAAKCWNRGGNALLDFGLKEQVEHKSPLDNTASQLSVECHAMNTIYRFRCGTVDLELTFTAPMFLDELDLLSRPVNYISYDITSNDGRKHDVKIYIEASPRWAVDQLFQHTESEILDCNGMVCFKAGTKTQNVLGKKGDDRRIDWGYFYLAGEKDNTVAALGTSQELRNAFAKGRFATKAIKADDAQGQMAFVRKLGKVNAARGKFLIGYDDIYSIQYFHNNLRPWWNRKGDKTMEDMLKAGFAEYTTLMDRCAGFDEELHAECLAAGGKEYAELCAAAYRQAIAAHKLVEAPNGDILWLSKENNSNGSIGTVDVTYPSAPLFLRYNPDLVKGILNHIFYYTESGKWGKPFPSHDVGTYPLANGQTYGGDMPVEESGNMIILAAALCEAQNDYSYAKEHWNALSAWTDYLAEYGLDPQNQLCTDDFAGHFAHNANLSVKAIMAIACYGKMARNLGYEAIDAKYTSLAKELAKEWMKMAIDGDHYKLTFDKSGTWSQKYNLVWDKILNLGIFPAEVAKTEIAYYLKKQNTYGLPLDNRKDYTKTDWIMWSATMAENPADFKAFVAPVYKFFNETNDRVPMSDWIYTSECNHRGFKARSVVGGYFIKLLDK